MVTRTPAEPLAASVHERRIERFRSSEGRLERVICRRDGSEAITEIGLLDSPSPQPAQLAAQADQLTLQSSEGTPRDGSGTIRLVDLFSGCGALSLGVVEGAAAVGMRTEIALATDLDQPALDVYAASLGPPDGAVRRVDLSLVLNGCGRRPTHQERTFLETCPEDIDVLVAGPPCQGVSSLNNHSRHDDSRNDLYGCVARFAELRRPRFCLIENVSSVISDQRRNVQRAMQRLREAGYIVDAGSVPLHRLGVPQTRRRHVVVAVRAGEGMPDVEGVLREYAVERPELRTVGWAVGDLGAAEGGCAFDSPSTASEENSGRMRWLFDRDEYELPNELRPPCHRRARPLDGGSGQAHTYLSMYGRLDWDRPAQTITSGYGSMGQGRYVHPRRPRTLTPHEAARLQMLPDSMRFDAVAGRTHWARMIGNAAPPKLSYVFTVDFLR